MEWCTIYVVWVGSAAVMCSLWTIRNKSIFEGKVIKMPSDSISAWSFLQSWPLSWSNRMQGVFDWRLEDAKRRWRPYSEQQDRSVFVCSKLWLLLVSLKCVVCSFSSVLWGSDSLALLACCCIEARWELSLFFFCRFCLMISRAICLS
jgi:hypothetical protein